MVPCGSALEAAERESRSSFDHTAELQIPSNDRQRLENHGNFAIWKSRYVHYLEVAVSNIFQIQFDSYV